MLYKTFMLPASGSEQTEENLNVFLRTHRIVSVRTEFVTGETPAWCVLVEYVQQSESLAKTSGKIDYMKILTPEEFAVFSKLRELRKELASKDGVPPFVVFTDEQLSLIVKQKPENLGKLTAIQAFYHHRSKAAFNQSSSFPRPGNVSRNYECPGTGF